MTYFKVNREHPVIIPSEKIYLNGILHIPNDAYGLVLFAHGSGSSRLSKRNQYVARILNDANLATLLFDLLTLEEEEIDRRTSELRFDIELLSSRLVDVTNWCLNEITDQNFSIGYFGASTGGGAALIAAAKNPDVVRSVVSRGGRPDLAGDYLLLVKAPTLLIVGGNDIPVIGMNEFAILQMNCIKKLKIVPGATHLFEEPGTLYEVANLARDWFIEYF